MRICFLHHSTGEVIWNGGPAGLTSGIGRKLSALVGRKRNARAFLPSLFDEQNRQFGTNYQPEESAFPKAAPYGWNNYPFDYYNIWVKHAGLQPFMQEPTLELLTQKYQIVMFKHCFPVSNIQPNNSSSDINSDYKSLANYKLQYSALRHKLYEFPNTKFIVWTAAALVKSRTNEEEAKRAKEFVDWVTREWDSPHDNIFIWDLNTLQTEGRLYCTEKFSQSATDSHPNTVFSRAAAKLLFQRIVDVIESGGEGTTVTGAPRNT